MNDDGLTTLRLEPGDSFVLTPPIKALCQKAIAYLDAGYPVHLAGPAGTGKTTLAMHIAALRAKPVMLIYGDDEFGRSDLVGREKGILSKKVIDNFIHSVLKTEESVRTQWVDNRLTTACKNGCTLVYDEFSRSRPEANNVLLAILEEGVLALPESCNGDSYMQVHPDFRAIFTSNPEEYAGVHKTQDALLDRMITIELANYDRETEIAIAAAKSGLSEVEARKIVTIVDKFRQSGVNNYRPTLRACIMIAKVMAGRGGKVSVDDSLFLATCMDVLGSDTLKAKKDGTSVAGEDVLRLIKTHLNSNGKRRLTRTMRAS